ncbi:ferredoxin [Pantoea sp. PA1]|jgi:ferredoxin|uniref:YfaE n=3 Tax=Pantoea ananas TaxID=553 RepID=D4GJ35_PANAM|nr:YfaE [Pantoea ananatis LMG 20103]ERM12165.1 2Fe-2S ferredoxin [Pantoea ananatis BRT175]MDQ1226678.1 ferredoxin [Pantoea ananatis]PKC35457.1 2Fe-2S ferredoxin [Pantoea ananatis 15320]PKC42641.1 2Fe-2S ferredoxin [Pantoea ananatis BRT98]PWW14899.1 ferredoxin [Pantoea sp. AG702]CCF08834.1 2Fe-2S Ferredoxin-1 [Pantoea ananatis LMG 5342]BAK11986.1 ferredoxin YfaE [Pantoea ananatis AJ13355]
MMSRSVVILRSSGTRLEGADDHPNLLTMLEANNLCVEFQCREGYCGSCRMRLLSGEVDYAEKPLAFIEQGEILPCCCKAKGEIELEL